MQKRFVGIAIVAAFAALAYPSAVRGQSPALAVPAGDEREVGDAATREEARRQRRAKRRTKQLNGSAAQEYAVPDPGVSEFTSNTPSPPPTKADDVLPLDEGIKAEGESVAAAPPAKVTQPHDDSFKLTWGKSVASVAPTSDSTNRNPEETTFGVASLSSLPTDSPAQRMWIFRAGFGANLVMVPGGRAKTADDGALDPGYIAVGPVMASLEAARRFGSSHLLGIKAEVGRLPVSGDLSETVGPLGVTALTYRLLIVDGTMKIYAGIEGGFANLQSAYLREQRWLISNHNASYGGGRVGIAIGGQTVGGFLEVAGSAVLADESAVLFGTAAGVEVYY